MSREEPIKNFKELIAEEYEIADLEETAPTPEKNTKKDDENVIYTSYFETSESILEQIEVADCADDAYYPPRSKKYIYILYRKLEGTFEAVQEYVYENKTIRPIIEPLLVKGAIGLPNGCCEYVSTSELIKEIKDYLYSYFEPPKFFENFLPYYVLFTWVYEKFPFIAYLHFIGLTGTGKTVAAETISSICYKPIDAAGSVTIASIFRIADKWKGTLFLDEFDLGAFGKEGYRAVLTFLKTGVSDRAVLRVEGEKKKEVEAFVVKAPKIFTSETPISDAGLQSRTFVIKMEKNRKQLPLYKLNSYHKKMFDIRNKLLLWRFRNLCKIDLSDIEYGFNELKSFDRRVQQILTPIYYLSDDTTRKELFEFAKEQEDETFRARRESVEGQIFQIIVDLHSLELNLTMIAEEYNKGRKSFLMTERRLGNIIRKVLNFNIEKMGHDKLSTLIIDDDRFNELKKYYGIDAGEHTAQSASNASSADDIVDTAEKIFNA